MDDAIWAAGERRQLWARDLGAPGEPLVKIGVGERERLRPLCRGGRLVCPFPDCPDPRLTTAGGLVRDHFRHLHRAPHAEHSPESWFHWLGKVQLAEWLRNLDAEVEVRLEARLENRQRPDVLAVFADGRRFAFEVQYAGITLDEWRRRHDGYRRQGLVDVWLFGHLDKHLKPVKAVPGVVVLTKLQQVLEAKGEVIRWINPDEQTIGLRLLESAASRHGLDRAPVVFEPLAACRVDDELRSPSNDREIAAARENRERTGRTKRQLLTLDRQINQQSRALKDAEKARRRIARRLAEERRERLATVWSYAERTDLARELVHRHNQLLSESNREVRQVWQRLSALEQERQGDWSSVPGITALPPRRLPGAVEVAAPRLRTTAAGLPVESPVPPAPPLPAPAVAGPVDPHGAAEQLTEFRGETLPIGRLFQHLRSSGIDTGAPFDLVIALERAGAIAVSRPFSLTGSRVRVL